MSVSIEIDKTRKDAPPQSRPTSTFSACRLHYIMQLSLGWDRVRKYSATVFYLLHYAFSQIFSYNSATIYSTCFDNAGYEPCLASDICFSLRQFMKYWPFWQLVNIVIMCPSFFHFILSGRTCQWRLMSLTLQPIFSRQRYVVQTDITMALV